MWNYLHESHIVDKPLTQVAHVEKQTKQLLADKYFPVAPYTNSIFFFNFLYYTKLINII